MTGNPDRPAARRTLDVLLLDAEHRQSLATMRVLARAGLNIGAVTGASEAWWAPSLRSRWCSFRSIVPDLAKDAHAYTQAILDVLAEHPARMVLPASDGTIQALRLKREAVQQYARLPLASEAALDIATSKTRTLALATELGLTVPRTVPVADCGEIPAALQAVGLPAVIKPTASWVERDGIGTRLQPNVVLTADEAARRVDEVLAAGGHALMQEYLPGRREAVTLFYARGQFWARLAQVSHREWPLLGGVSVLCETIALPDDIGSDAERLVRAIGLEGCSMVEFRRDQAGRPVLMEVNPRLGGSASLAISAGINFPKLLYAWALDQTLEAFPAYRVGQRLRWLAGDVWNLKCVFESQGRPDVPPRLSAAATFATDFFRPIQVDGLAFDDLRPFLADMNKFVVHHSLLRARRVLRRPLAEISER